MVTTINTDDLISILPIYYLFRDQKTYLSREALEVQSAYPQSAVNTPFTKLKWLRLQLQPLWVYFHINTYICSRTTL